MPVGESPDAETTSRRSAAKSRRQDDHKPTNVNIELIVIGKTDSKEIESLLAMYARRINFYCRFAVTVLPDVKNTKNLSAKQQRTTVHLLTLIGPRGNNPRENSEDDHKCKDDRIYERDLELLDAFRTFRCHISSFIPFPIYPAGTINV